MRALNALALVMIVPAVAIAQPIVLDPNDTLAVYGFAELWSAATTECSDGAFDDDSTSLNAAPSLSSQPFTYADTVELSASATRDRNKYECVCLELASSHGSVALDYRVAVGKIAAAALVSSKVLDMEAHTYREKANTMAIVITDSGYKADLEIRIPLTLSTAGYIERVSARRSVFGCTQCQSSRMSGGGAANITFVFGGPTPTWQNTCGTDQIGSDMAPVSAGGTEWWLQYTAAYYAQVYCAQTVLCSIDPACSLDCVLDPWTGSSGTGDIAHAVFRYRACEDSCPGDTNGDGVIDQSDLGILLTHFGTTIHSANYNPDADVDGDLQIGQQDLAAVLAGMNTNCCR